MATRFEWTKLFFENSKVIITMWCFVLGTLGYNVYGFIEANNAAKVIEPIEVAQPVEPKPEAIFQKMMAAHLAEFH